MPERLQTEEFENHAQAYLRKPPPHWADATLLATAHSGLSEKEAKSKSLTDLLAGLEKEDRTALMTDFLTTTKVKDIKANMPVDHFLHELSNQKARKRRAEELDDKHRAEQQKHLDFLRSKSAPAIPTVGQLDCVLPSTMTGSAKYSFGKSRHLKGNFKIPVGCPRDADYEGDRARGPGVGSYHLRQAICLNEATESAGGPTGGWKQADHSEFMRWFGEYEEQATAKFFDHLQQYLPNMPRADMVEHVRWLAQYRCYLAEKNRRATRYRAENAELARVQKLLATGLDLKDIEPELSAQAAQSMLKDRLEEQRQVQRMCKMLMDQAAEEEIRMGGKRIVAKVQPQQVFQGKVLDANFRGHPEFRKSPGYTFGTSVEPRDLREKRFSSNSHVRSSSHLDNPGPGAYLGHAAVREVLPSQPSWSFRMKLPPAKVDKTCPNGPGYSGDEHAGSKINKDIKFTQRTHLGYSFGKEHARALVNSGEVHAITTLISTPDNVGPGSYLGHTTGFISQF